MNALDSRARETRLGLLHLPLGVWVVVKAPSDDNQKLEREQLQHLLQVAGISPSNNNAAAWLRQTLEGARSSYKVAKERPIAADYNTLLEDIEKSAKELIDRIERLRRYSASWLAFWRSTPFGPVDLERVELREVLSTLENIASAADAAKDRRHGRRRKTGKKNAVDLAFAFFVRFSPHQPSGTPTGAFARFAREFYSAATGSEPDQDGGLDRQIREAAKHLSIDRERAQRKSVKKSRLSS